MLCNHLIIKEKTEYAIISKLKRASFILQLVQFYTLYAATCLCFYFLRIESIITIGAGSPVGRIAQNQL
jgi:hypothetical protein